MTTFDFFRNFLEFFDLKRYLYENVIRNLFFLGFLIFWPQIIKNDQIYIQTIEFIFKCTNQELTAHYHPPILVTNDTEGYHPI
jgi:hypothetical protein